MKRFLPYWGASLLLWLAMILPSNAAGPVDPKVLHVLNRLSFGPNPGEVDRVQQMGTARYIQEQLDPEKIVIPAKLRSRLQTLPLRSRRARASRVPNNRQVLEKAVQARLFNALYSPRQLEEVMVDFWFNHFNVNGQKGFSQNWVGDYDEKAIRPHVLGRFRDLLGATAHHPAMLFYLDNWRNTDPNSPKAKGRFKGLNENYARELMELHTLGVDDGYTQNDVIVLAKIFTGWGFPPGQQPRTAGADAFYFDADRHDPSSKVFLGKTITGKGEAEGEEALDILADSPITARRISYKLAQYFVADTPPDPLVKQLTDTYLNTKGDIREMLKTLFESKDFAQPSVYQAKFKTPYRYVLSTIRAAGIDVQDFGPLYTMLQQSGMPPYGCPTPNGYANTQSAWLNPNAMNQRIGFVTALSFGRVRLGTSRNTVIDPNNLLNTLGNHFSSNTQQAIADQPSELKAALILGSPEFMRY